MTFQVYVFFTFLWEVQDSLLSIPTPDHQKSNRNKQTKMDKVENKGIPDPKVWKNNLQTCIILTVKQVSQKKVHTTSFIWSV